MWAWLFRGRVCLAHTGSLSVHRGLRWRAAFSNRRTTTNKHRQILLHLCSALQSPISSHSHTKHLSGLPFCSSQGTSTEYWSLILTIYLSLNKSMWGRTHSKTQATVDYYFLSSDAHTKHFLAPASLSCKASTKITIICIASGHI